MRKEKAKNESFIVRVRCTTLKDVYCERCTEEQARTSPFEFYTDEQEVDLEDWEVLSVEKNT